MADHECVYRRSEEVAWRIIEDAAVIVTPHDGMVHQFNETATALWKRLETPATAGDLAASLCEEFNVDEETAAKHTLEFLNELKSKAIIKEMPE